MNNSDMPITPFFNGQGHPHHFTQIAFDNIGLVSGLTKREHFAGLAMQGILASDIKKEMSLKQVYEWAVRNADALLKELDQS